jgi:hypothetical protein
MSNYKLVIPLLNNRATFLKGSFVQLSESIIIEKITDEEHSAFYRLENKEIEEAIKINDTKCIKAKFDNEPTLDEIIKLCAKINFLLNLFSDKNSPIIQWSALIEGDNKLIIKKIIELDAIAKLTHLCTMPYKMKESTKRQALLQMFQIINQSIANDRNVYFTIRKFNSSLVRSDINDKIIDSTICLESLISGINELSFRLSLSIAYITKSVPAERLECFTKIKELYDVRSKIVHGDLDNKALAKITDINNQWDYYHEIIKSALTYYLFYVSSRTRDQWNTHLKNLVLNFDNRIVV